MRPASLITTLLIFITTPCSFGQAGRPSEPLCTQHHRLVIHSGNASDPVLQYFLKEISRGNDKGIDQAAFFIEFRTDIFHSPINDSLPAIWLMADSLNILGDSSYKSFDISSLLIPSRLQVSLNMPPCSLSSPHAGASAELTPGIPFLLIRPDGNPSGCEGTFVVPDLLRIQPVYPGYAMDRLHEYVSVIDDYYTADALLDTVWRLLDQCENGSPLSPEKKLLHLAESENILDHLKNKSFNIRLPLQSEDPILFQSTFHHLIYRYSSLKNSLTNLVHRIGVPTHPGAWDVFARAYTSRFMKYQEISKNAHFYEIPSYEQMATVAYTQARLAAFFPVLVTLSGKDQSAIQRLIHAIVHQWIAISRQKLDSGLYYDALVPIENARHLTAMGYCPLVRDDLEAILDQAYNGMCQSYLQLSYRFLEKANEEMCEQYLAKAFEWMDPTHEPGAEGLFDTILRDLALRRIGSSMSLPDSRPDEKLGVLEKAKASIANFYPYHPLRDSITVLQLLVREQQYNELIAQWEESLADSSFSEADRYAGEIIRFAESNLQDPLYGYQAQDVIRKIHSHTYQTLLYEAQRYTALRDYSMAVQSLNEADSLATLYGITPTPVYRKLLETVYKPVFMDKMSQGRMHMWLNDLEKANAILIECQDMAERYYLTADPDVAGALTDLRDKIRMKRKKAQD